MQGVRWGRADIAQWNTGVKQEATADRFTRLCLKKVRGAIGVQG